MLYKGDTKEKNNNKMWKIENPFWEESSLNSFPELVPKGGGYCYNENSS